MPTISYFFGIAIRIYFNEHPPPHFHALYGDDVGQVEIATGKRINGRLPSRVLAFVEVAYAPCGRTHGGLALGARTQVSQ
jgi:hypothetical protein